MKKIIIITALIAALTIFCAVQAASAKESPNKKIHHINMGGDYGGVAYKCQGPNMVYVSKDDTQATSSVFVVKNDSQCVVSGDTNKDGDTK